MKREAIKGEIIMETTVNLISGSDMKKVLKYVENRGVRKGMVLGIAGTLTLQYGYKKLIEAKEEADQEVENVVSMFKKPQ